MEKMEKEENYIVIPRGTKIINKQGFDYSNIARIELPEGLEEIGVEAFAYCKSLQTIKLPKTLKIISNRAFYGCENLQNIELSEGLEEIGAEAFAYCKSLKTIKLPGGLKTISPLAFWCCENLQNIELSEGLEEIGYLAFMGCESLQTIKLPKGLKKIGASAFSGRKLSSIESLEGLEEIDKLAFAYCKSLQTIKLPGGLKKIGDAAFYGCNLSSIEIKYDTFDDVLNTANALVDYAKENGFGDNKVNLVLNGQKFNFIQKMKLASTLSKFFIVSYEQQKNIEKETDKKELNLGFVQTDDEEINSYLLKISEEINMFPNKEEIVEKINQLLLKYKKDLVTFKPNYESLDDSDINLSVPKTSITETRAKMLASLQLIHSECLGKKRSHEIFKKLSNYKTLFNTNQDELSENNDSLEDKIKSIKFITSIMEEDKEKKLEAEINQAIKSAIETTKKELEFNESKELDLESKRDVLLDLELKINNIYIDLIEKYGKEVEYLRLSNILKVSNEEEIKDNDLHNLIRDTRKVINGLYKPEYKELFGKNLDSILEKYSEVVKDIIDSNDREKIDAKGIEKAVTQELVLLLSSVNKYIPVDNYERTFANEENIVLQLRKSKELLNKEDAVELKDNERKQAILSYVADVHNKMVSEIKDYEILAKIKEELVNKFSEKEKEFEESLDIHSIDDYNRELQKILGLVAETDLNINAYLSRLEEYNNYTR